MRPRVCTIIKQKAHAGCFSLNGYTKKIAVIKQVQGGFSSDSGALSGVVKAETYAGFLKVEVSLINFAPLTEGRYVLGITDGLRVEIFEGNGYEGESDFNLSYGFAFLVCFCNGGCQPIASAACGQMACALPDLKEEMKKREIAKSANVPQSRRTKKPARDSAGSGAAPYDDEAIAEENYYEYELDEDGGALRKDKAQKADGGTRDKDEENFSAVKAQKTALNQAYSRGNYSQERECAQTDAQNPALAGGDFYERMKGEIEKIFAAYPKEEGLERVMEGSRWARISYGKDKYYVFGVLSIEGAPRYICYGVPSKDAQTPPKSLANCSAFTAVEGGGYWIMYQDANTGVSVKIAGI